MFDQVWSCINKLVCRVKHLPTDAVHNYVMDAGRFALPAIAPRRRPVYTLPHVRDTEAQSLFLVFYDVIVILKYKLVKLSY